MILVRFRGPMKLGFMIARIATSTIKMIKMKYSLISELIFLLFSIFPPLTIKQRCPKQAA